MADDHGDGIASECQDRITDENRDADTEVFRNEGLCLHEEVVELKADLFIEEDQISQIEKRFKNTCKEGCQSRSRDAHFRSAEMTEDEDVVSRKVYNERADRYIQRKSRLPDASENDGDDQ